MAPILRPHLRLRGRELLTGSPDVDTVNPGARVRCRTDATNSEGIRISLNRFVIEHLVSGQG
jgi:hypothetical protein